MFSYKKNSGLVEISQIEIVGYIEQRVHDISLEIRTVKEYLDKAIPKYTTRDHRAMDISYLEKEESYFYQIQYSTLAFLMNLKNELMMKQLELKNFISNLDQQKPDAQKIKHASEKIQNFIELLVLEIDLALAKYSFSVNSVIINLHLFLLTKQTEIAYMSDYKLEKSLNISKHLLNKSSEGEIVEGLLAWISLLTVYSIFAEQINAYLFSIKWNPILFQIFFLFFIVIVISLVQRIGKILVKINKYKIIEQIDMEDE